MREPASDLPKEKLISLLRGRYAIDAVSVTFLPIGYDAETESIVDLTLSCASETGCD